MSGVSVDCTLGSKRPTNEQQNVPAGQATIHNTSFVPNWAGPGTVGQRFRSDGDGVVVSGVSVMRFCILPLDVWLLVVLLLNHHRSCWDGNLLRATACEWRDQED